MTKTHPVYTCQECGAQFSKWAGCCSACGTWNRIIEETESAPLKGQKMKSIPKTGQPTAMLSDIEVSPETRWPTQFEEFNHVLGGGIVTGSAVLIGGDPGVGKSTLLLQMLAHLKQPQAPLYISGEESLQQISLRAQRLELPKSNLKLLAETQVEKIIATALQEKPSIMVVDSIQTMWTETLSSAPGSVSQVRECAAFLVQLAKQSGIALFLVGHVTKEGALAGPRVLEHMVDAVLYFEGDINQKFRMIRATKNRFGTVNELGIFAMTEKGLREVNNPSAIFLSHYEEPVPGSITTVTWEGSRPLLVEIQALTDESRLNNPRRVTLGLEFNRLSMLLAVLHRHSGVATYDRDVFVNVVGGVRVIETAADLPVILAILSSLRDRPLPNNLIAFGEVGLAGEIRPIQNGQERLKEAQKHGFKTAIVPFANAPKKPIEGMEIVPVKYLGEALKILK